MPTIISSSKGTQDDHPLNEPVEQQQQQQQQQQNGNESRSLVVENERLREELIELRRQMSQMADLQKQQQQYRIPPPLVPSPSNSNKKGNGRSTMKRKNSNSQLEMSLIIKSGNHANNIAKDHQSASTLDDRETVEPDMDIESHQSASGLHHRSPSVTGYTSTTSKTVITNTSAITRRTEVMTDDESSSCYNEDDPLAEARGLIGGDLRIRTTSHQNTTRKQEKDGILHLEQQQRVAAEALVLSTIGDDEAIPNHHQMTFFQALSDRAGWLIGLLVFQSLSSFILARNESLLQHHTVIVQFLTMLVGAGGNAGNQASVGVVRGIAVGSVTRSNAKRVLGREFAMGVALSLILGLAGFVRAKVFAVPWMETIAITTSLFLIVIISVAVGAMLPLGMQAVGIDPAHSSTTIQVVMDITGVLITVQVSGFMLDSDFRDVLG
jgi:cation transporter-like permease